MSTAAPAFPRATSVAWFGKALFAAVVLAHAPLIGLHLFNVWPKEYYQYMPLIPIGAWILATQRSKDAAGEPDVGVYTMMQGAFGVFLLAASVLLYSPWLSVPSLVVNLGVAARLAGGADLARAIRPGALCLLLMLPMPLDADRELLLWLQRATVKWSGAVYEWAGGYCLIVGAVVQLPHLAEPLFIADACSGIQSLFAVLTCTIFYLIWSGRGPFQSLVVLVASFGWVMAANIGRVLVVMAITKPDSLDLSKGWPHQTLGMLTFLSAFLLTLSTDRLLLAFNPPRALPDSIDDDEAPAPTGVNRSALLASGVFTMVSFVAGLWSAKEIFTSARSGNAKINYQFEAAALGPNHLPADLGAWKLMAHDGVVRRADDDHMAARSQQWRYSNGFQDAIVSFDYPYPETHDLQGCYENIGWTRSARDHIAVAPAYAPPFGDFVRLRLQKRTEEYAYVAFSAFTQSGQPESFGRIRAMDAFQDRVAGVWNRLTGRGGETVRLRQSIYQVQVVSMSPLPLTPEQVKQLDELFLLARRHFAPPKMDLSKK